MRGRAAPGPPRPSVAGVRSPTRPDPELVHARLRRLAGLAGGETEEPDPGDGSPQHRSDPPRPSARVLTVAAVAAVLVAGWLTWHAGGDTSPTVVTSAVAAGSAPLTSPAPSASPAAEVVVQVVGAVRRPGVVHLPAGSRVQDAIEAVGGLRPGRSTGAVNLARRLVDGEQIVVGRKAVPGGTAPTGAGPTVGAGPVDLNLADAAALDTLPGIGPVTAAAILRWRDEHGGFTSVEQLQEVDGIGPKTYAQLAPLVVVAGS